MKIVRVFFSKTGPAVFISHLDLMRAMQRALKRAGLPVWYTEGYNPHIYLTFALPISLGFEGLRESMDLKVADEVDITGFGARLAPCLPEGIGLVGVDYPVMKPAEIAFARYRIAIQRVEQAVKLRGWIS